MVPDTTHARYVKFTEKLLEDKEFLYEVYRSCSKMYNRFPENVFPIGVGKEVFKRNPMQVQINGWGKGHSGSMESLIKKIVRAYESAKSDRWSAASGAVKTEEKVQQVGEVQQKGSADILRG